MRVRDLAHKDGKAGSNGAWHSYTYSTGHRDIYHYSTLMLAYDTLVDGVHWDGNLDTVYVSTGHGSVSDQGGMNQLFRELGMPLRFDRAGGAAINRVWTNPYRTETFA